MKHRLSTPEEIKLAIICIIEIMKQDDENLSFPHNEDDDIDNYSFVKENTNFSTLELPDGNKIINTIFCMELDDTFDILSEQFIMFPNNTVKNITTWEYVEKNETLTSLEKNEKEAEIIEALEVSRDAIKESTFQKIHSKVENYLKDSVNDAASPKHTIDYIVSEIKKYETIQRKVKEHWNAKL